MLEDGRIESELRERLDIASVVVEEEEEGIRRGERLEKGVEEVEEFGLG